MPRRPRCWVWSGRLLRGQTTSDAEGRASLSPAQNDRMRCEAKKPYRPRAGRTNDSELRARNGARIARVQRRPKTKGVAAFLSKRQAELARPNDPETAHPRIVRNRLPSFHGAADLGLSNASPSYIGSRFRHLACCSCPIRREHRAPPAARKSISTLIG